MPKQKYYAIRKGNKIGIFPTRKACNLWIKGYKGCEFAVFDTLKEAKYYLNNPEYIPPKPPKKPKKSKAEIILEEYLSQYYTIKTQKETLKCINPKTKRQLPYDIEIPELKTIIEVQGEQHYEYNPYMHKNPDGFRNQLFKDQYKKEYAQSQGYKILYITSTDILDDGYKVILKKYNII